MSHAGRRRAWLLSFAGYALVVAFFVRAYLPGSPAAVSVLRPVFGLAVVALVVAAWRRLPGEASRRFWIVAAPPLLVMMGFLGVMHAMGYIVAVVIEPAWAVIGGALEVAAVGAAFVLARRPERRWPAAGLATSALFAGSILYIPLCTWMWWPPSVERCNAPARGDGVARRLSPPELPGQLSYPYDLVYLPDHERVVASFKMAGNLTLAFWDDPTANRLVSMAAGGEDGVDVLSLEGPTLPEYLLYVPEHRRLLVTHLGYDRSYLSAVDVDDTGRLSLAQRVEVDYEPHKLVPLPGGRTVGEVQVKKRLLAIDPWRLREVRRVPLWPEGQRDVFDFMVVHAAVSPDGERVYASLLGTHLIELDLTSDVLRLADVPFGAGQVAVDGERGRILLADYVRRSLVVIDAVSMRHAYSLDLPYTPRAVGIDAERDLLVVADWFSGQLHFYDLRGDGDLVLEDLATPVDVGPYVRELVTDVAGGRIFTASSCGIYEVDLRGIDFAPDLRERQGLR